jgi:uncharacterized protein YunC (DUF1805 family)
MPDGAATFRLEEVMNRRRLLALMAAATLAGCGASRSDTADSEGSFTPRHQNVFTLEDIQNAQQQNIGSVLDMIRRYRSEWLRPILASGRTVEPTAYQDMQRLGGTGALRNIPLGAVTLIRYLTPSEAQGQLGIANIGGAIVVSTQ